MDATPRLDHLVITAAAPSVLLARPDGGVGGGAEGVLHGDRRVLSAITLSGPPGVRRTRDLTPTSLTERLAVEGAAGGEIRVRLAADFASVETIKSGVDTPVVEPVSALHWESGGISCTVTAPGAAIDGSTLVWTVDSDDFTAVWTATFTDPDAPFTPAHPLVPTLTVECDDPRLPRLVERCTADLNGLLLTDGPDTFAAAGAPWYLTLFGRDSLWTARLVLPLSVDLAGGTLRTLARLQGTRHDPATAEEPGKIPHERRRAAFEYAGMSLPALYYGTVDATPLWICLLHDAWRAGLPDDEVRALLPTLRAALDWTAGHPRFLTYADESGTGLANQGWKDSPDAVRFPDGTPAEAPIALCEVQAYAHEALVSGAALLAAFDTPAPEHLDRAHRLAGDFRADFGDLPALALDGTGRRVEQVTSNLGHLPGTGLLDDAGPVAARLTEPDLLGPFGLRTLSTESAVHDPVSYHCGSVWPHDTAIAARALAAAGFADQAAEVAARLLAAAADGELPEVLGGQERREPYPSSCRPQAWSAAAGISVLWRLLGLSVDVPDRTVALRPPHPSPVGALSVHGIPLPGGTLSVSIDAEGTVLDVTTPPGYRVIP